MLWSASSSPGKSLGIYLAIFSHIIQRQTESVLKTGEGTKAAQTEGGSALQRHS